METDQAEQLDILLNQSAKVLTGNRDTEETDASTTSKWDSKSSSPFDNQDTWTEIVMAEKIGIDLTSPPNQLLVTESNILIILSKRWLLT